MNVGKPIKKIVYYPLNISIHESIANVVTYKINNQKWMILKNIITEHNKNIIPLI